MIHPSRRQCLALVGFGLVASVRAEETPAVRRSLPLETIFQGRPRFDAIVEKAAAEKWSALPIGERIMRVAGELEGLPYRNFTLEIDDHVESPSVNLEALDCWTFFEQCLGLARLLAIGQTSPRPEDLLRQIEITRYYGGVCTGNYLERIHYLADWFFENHARGVCQHLTPSLPGARRIEGRKVSEMTTLWKSYRYLRQNPELRAPMKEIEDRVARLPVYFVPKSEVASIEDRLQPGDVIGIATRHHGAFCSHVGLACRGEDGVTRLMHASRDHQKVIVDASISDYLAAYRAHAGILVGRPREVQETVTDRALYEENLRKLLG